MKTYRYIGSQGIPSAIHQVPAAEAKEYLQKAEAEGCWAWYGRTMCGARPAAWYEGNIVTCFQAYRVVWPHGIISPYEPCYLVLCEHHGRNLFQDMPVKLRKGQRQQLAIYLAMFGEHLSGE